MRIVVIGGSGHIGTFLIPRLVRAGHDVINISRGQSATYVSDPTWQQVQHVTADRLAEDHDITFPARVAGLEPDVVVDLICFTLDSATKLVAGLRGQIDHLLYCGSIWRHGPSTRMPITEANGGPPVGEYGIEKAATVEMLKAETSSGGVVTTSLHPGHIVGPGWHPIGPLGNLDPGVWHKLSAGLPVDIPGIGSEFMHHVHADDVAHAFEATIDHRDTAAGQDFNIVAPTALNVRGYAQIAASWFDQTADLHTISWEQLRASTPDDFYDSSWAHLSRNHYVSIDKARNLIGYAPRYEPESAILESVRWLIEHHQLDPTNPLTT